MALECYVRCSKKLLESLKLCGCKYAWWDEWGIGEGIEWLSVMNQYIIGQQDRYNGLWGHLSGPFESYAEAEGLLVASSRENPERSIAICCWYTNRHTNQRRLLPVSDYYRGGEKLAGSPRIFACPGSQTGYILISIGKMMATLSANAWRRKIKLDMIFREYKECFCIQK